MKWTPQKTTNSASVWSAAMRDSPNESPRASAQRHDLVALVVVAEDEHPGPERRLGRPDPIGQLVGAGRRVARRGVRVCSRSMSGMTSSGRRSGQWPAGTAWSPIRGDVGPGAVDVAGNQAGVAASVLPVTCGRARAVDGGGPGPVRRHGTLVAWSPDPSPAPSPTSPAPTSSSTRRPGPLRGQGQVAPVTGSTRTSRTRPAWPPGPPRWSARPTTSSGWWWAPRPRPCCSSTT